MTCSGFKIKTSIELPWSGDRRTPHGSSGASERSECRATNAPERDLYSTRSRLQSGGDRGRGGTCCARLATLHCVYVRHCFNSIRLQSIRYWSENTAYLLHSLESSAKSVTVKVVFMQNIQETVLTSETLSYSSSLGGFCLWHCIPTIKV